MTNPPPAPAQQFKSAASNRFVMPGWMNLLPGTPDSIEVQFDLAPEDHGRAQGLLLLDYWETPEKLTLQGILPVRAFTANPDGWCVMLPARGDLIIRAIDPQPNPPVLAPHWIHLNPETKPGTTVHVAVKFPGGEGTPPALQNLLRS